MSWKTLVFLVVAVLLLGFLAWWIRDREHRIEKDIDMPLFEDLDESSVTAVVPLVSPSRQ